MVVNVFYVQEGHEFWGAMTYIFVAVAILLLLGRILCRIKSFLKYLKKFIDHHFSHQLYIRHIYMCICIYIISFCCDFYYY